MSYSSFAVTTPEAEIHALDLYPMGFTLRVISNSPAVLEAARVSFGRFTPPDSPSPPDFTFRLWVQAGLGEGFGPPVFRREGQLLTQSTGPGATLAAHLSSGEAMGWFSPEVVARTAFFRWHFVELALFQMLEARGLMGVHASALVTGEGTLLLRAPSGGGKSTLALAGALRGWQALAEDVVWVDEARGRWWGTPWSFHLRPDAVALFPQLAGLSPILQTSGELKLEIDPERLRAGSTITWARPGAIVFVQRLPGGRSRLETIDAAAAQALWPAAQTGLESRLAHHPPVIARLLAARTWLLTYGDDLDEALDALAGVG